MIEYLTPLPFILILITYILYFIRRRKGTVFPKRLKVIKQLHYSLLAICLGLLIMSNFGFFLSSIWSTKIIAWAFLISACFIIVNRHTINNQFERTYVNILFFSPLLLIITWVIPMLGAWTCYSFSLFFYTDNSTIAFNDKNYMLKFEEGFLVYDYDPTLFIKYGIIQKKNKDIELNNWNFERNIEIKSINEDTILIKYFDQSKLLKDTLIKL